jgi:hypothetical protein
VVIWLGKEREEGIWAVLRASLVTITGGGVPCGGVGAGAFFFGLAAVCFFVMLQGGWRIGK